MWRFKMGKYRIKIEEGGYRDVFDLTLSDLDPSVIDEIMLEIYTILKHASETQTKPSATITYT